MDSTTEQSKAGSKAHASSQKADSASRTVLSKSANVPLCKLCHGRFENKLELIVHLQNEHKDEIVEFFTTGDDDTTVSLYSFLQSVCPYAVIFRPVCQLCEQTSDQMHVALQFQEQLLHVTNAHWDSEHSDKLIELQDQCFPEITDFQLDIWQVAEHPSPELRRRVFHEQLRTINTIIGQTNSTDTITGILSQCIPVIQARIDALPPLSLSDPSTSEVQQSPQSQPTETPLEPEPDTLEVVSAERDTAEGASSPSCRHNSSSPPPSHNSPDAISVSEDRQADELHNPPQSPTHKRVLLQQHVDTESLTGNSSEQPELPWVIPEEQTDQSKHPSSSSPPPEVVHSSVSQRVSPPKVTVSNKQVKRELLDHQINQPFVCATGQNSSPKTSTKRRRAVIDNSSDDEIADLPSTSTSPPKKKRPTGELAILLADLEENRTLFQPTANRRRSSAVSDAPRSATARRSNRLSVKQEVNNNHLYDDCYTSTSSSLSTTRDDDVQSITPKNTPSRSKQLSRSSSVASSSKTNVSMSLPSMSSGFPKMETAPEGNRMWKNGSIMCLSAENDDFKRIVLEETDGEDGFDPQIMKAVAALEFQIGRITWQPLPKKYARKR